MPETTPWRDRGDYYIVIEGTITYCPMTPWPR
jgi:hypothetical protein